MGGALKKALQINMGCPQTTMPTQAHFTSVTHIGLSPLFLSSSLKFPKNNAGSLAKHIPSKTKNKIP